MPLTDFIGVGVAKDYEKKVHPLTYSELSDEDIFQIDYENIADLIQQSCENLKRYNKAAGSEGIKLAPYSMGDVSFYEVTTPNEYYRSSWFTDVDLMRQINEFLIKDNSGKLPLYVPASRSKFYVVFEEDVAFKNFVWMLYKFYMKGEATKHAIYPLPHTITQDGWKEWIPFSDHPTATMLSNLRTLYRGKMYEKQKETMDLIQKEMGNYKPYKVTQMVNGLKVSYVEWTNRDLMGLIPQTDVIVFRTGFEPWEDEKRVFVKTDAVLKNWDSMQVAQCIWPPRYAVQGFPSDEVLEKIVEDSNWLF